MAEREVLEMEGDTAWTPSQRQIRHIGQQPSFDANNPSSVEKVVVAKQDACNDKMSRSTAGEIWNRSAKTKQVGLIMAVLVVVALFGDDVRVLFAPPSWDEAWSAATLVVMIVFAIEWLGNCTFQRGYFLSLFFFLDLLATISLCVDVGFIRDELFGAEDYLGMLHLACTAEYQIQSGLVVASEFDPLDQNGAATSTAQVLRTGRAARVGARAARVVRIIRFCRVLRVFKMFRFLDSTHSAEDENEMRANPSKIGGAIAGKAAQRVVIIILTVFSATSLLVAFNETLVDTAPQVCNSPVCARHAANTLLMRLCSDGAGISYCLSSRVW